MTPQGMEDPQAGGTGALPNPVDSSPLTVAAAARVLTPLRQHFDAAVHRVAQLCTVAGRLDAARLDAHQVVCHDLALASADLLAAETVLAQAPGASPRDTGLALAFVAEAAQAVLARLDSVALETGQGLPGLQALRPAPT